MEEKLNPKQKKFIEMYLGEAHFNGTKAAELAGYSGSKNTLGVTAYDLLRNPKIKEELDKVLSAMTMPSNVVLTRLTEIAEGKVTDFLDGNKNFDLERAKKEGKDHLLKKVKIERTIRQRKTEIRDDMRGFLAEDEIEDLESEVEIIFEKTEFEMYSAHEALRDLGKHHKLFTDKIESENKNENVNMTVEEWNEREKKRIKEAEETLNQFDD